MKNAKKQTRTLIALFLMLTFTATTILVALPVVNAHYPPWTIPTWTYVTLTNNVIGVGQETTVVYWSNALPPTAQGAYGDRWVFTLDVTEPNGNNETLGPYTSDPVGGGWLVYTPTEVGTYTFVAKLQQKTVTGYPLYPNQNINQINGAAYVNDTYLASTSEPAFLTVQQNQIQAWSEPALPTEYWTRPLNDLNRGWYVLAANWLAGAAQNYPAGAAGGTTTTYSYGQGPESAHIMWTHRFWAGGIMDARYGESGYQTAQYDGLDFSPPLIIDGKLYYNVRASPKIGWYCLDLYTGEQLFFHNSTGPVNYALRSDASGALLQEQLSFGQILAYDSPNQHGGYPYLWSTYGPGMPTGKPSSGGQTWPAGNQTWMMLDAFTGNYICSITNVSATGTNVYGKDGSILYYNLVGTGANRRLTVWNTTQAIQEGAGPNSQYSLRNWYWCWRPFLNMTFDGSLGYSLNISIPAVQGNILSVRGDQMVIGGSAGSNNENGVTQGQLWALNLDPSKGAIGSQLWTTTFTPPSSAGNKTISMGAVDPDDDVFVFSCALTRERWGYSLTTGQELWKSSPEPSMNFYGMSTNIYQGMLLSSGYSGVLIAYDIKTGNILWNYTATQEGFESPYGNFPIGISSIADGKIYLTSSEHSPTQPMWRGSYLRCVNASNGAEVWKCLFWGMGMGSGSGAALGDGYIVGLNAYDNQIYCFGKGPSATTVTAPDTAILVGTNFVIRGTVTDQCAGAKAIADKEGLKDGVPAVSDESQRAWMEYLYEQQAKPTDATGVPVLIDVIDANGNYRNIGSTTSDTSGTFSYTWKPDISGDYTVIATFSGSASYYGSSAETDFTASETQASATPQPIVAQAPTEMYISLGATVATIIAIAIVGAVLLLAFRKR